MWVLLDRGDAAIVPSPSYPIHIYGPLFAGADLRQVPMRSLADPRVAERLRRRLLRQPHHGLRRRLAEAAGARDLVPAQPDRRRASTSPFMQRVVDFCREREMIVVHDFAYADVGFDGYRPPSHPAGRRRQGVRRRAVLDDQELLDGRLALRVPASATPRSCRRWSS